MSKSLKENQIKEFDTIDIIPSLKGGSKSYQDKLKQLNKIKDKF